MSDTEFTPAGRPLPPVECVGWLGRIFGHKFVKHGWSSNGACFRCGIVEGTWTR